MDDKNLLAAAICPAQINVCTVNTDESQSTREKSFLHSS